MMTCDRISPIKCALKFKPPLLAIVYKDLKTNKTRRRTIPLRGFMKEKNVSVYGDKLLRNSRHGEYVSKLPRQQLDSLLQRVKDCNKSKVALSPDHTPTPSPTHGLLAGFPTLTSHISQRQSLNQEFEDALDELLGPEDNEDILDVTLPDTVSGLPKPSVLEDSSSPPQAPQTVSSPLGKLPPLSELTPLSTPLTETPNISTVKQQEEQLEQLLTAAAGDNPSESMPDYSADFDSESERSTATSQNQPPLAGEDKSLSFAIEELEGDDDSSLVLSDEGENFAGDHLLNSFSGEDFRVMNIVTPPPQTNGIQSTITGNSEDLNKVDDHYLAQRKAEMETLFQANQSKPGDQGYVYDKEVDFNAPKMESGWDSEDDSMSDF